MIKKEVDDIKHMSELREIEELVNTEISNNIRSPSQISISSPFKIPKDNN